MRYVNKRSTEAYPHVTDDCVGLVILHCGLNRRCFRVGLDILLDYSQLSAKRRDPVCGNVLQMKP